MERPLAQDAPAVAPAVAPTFAVAPVARVLARLAANPRAIVLRAGGFALDAANLDAIVGGVATRLGEAGVGGGDCVALPAVRNWQTIVGLLAISVRGAAYVPLDPDYPEARLAAMLEDAAPRLAIGLPEHRARLPAQLAWIDLDTAPGAAASGMQVADGELAYVLFTSGSTGRPKGVAMRRAAVGHLIDWHLAHPRLGAPARTLQFAPLGFDVSFQEIFSTLAGGGCLVLPTDAERRDPYALLDLIARERIERLFLPYVGLQALAEAAVAGGKLPTSLRDVITAGEQLRITPAIRALFAALPGAALHNHYGPTETHVVTAFELSGASDAWPELPPIGSALPHVRTRIVDAALVDVAAASEGELLLGGDCLAAGYIHRPELTSERFIEQGGARWYRTGDRVLDRGDGVLEYFGRIDEQIKLDGYRIEPAEIEAVLCRHADVAESAVVVAESAGSRRLVAHVVPRDAHRDDAALAAALRTHAGEHLADYLVPQQIVVHAALPLTASGKIDRRALARSGDVAALHWDAGATLQNQLLQLWKQLLGVDDLDAGENLFERGARSLLVVRALTELRRHGHVLSAVQMYEFPSVAAQAAALDEPRAAPIVAAAAADPARGDRQRAALARFGPRAGGAR